MDSMTYLLRLGIILGVSVVVILGLVVFLVARPKKKPAEIRKEVVSSVEPSARPELTQGMEEIGRILYHPMSDKTLIYVDGRLIGSPGELIGNQEKALRLLYANLQKWFSPGIQAPAAGTHETSFQPAAAAQPVRTLNDRFVQPPAAVDKPGLLTGFIKSIQSDVKDTAKPKSIAQQVDDVLQEQLRNSPLHERGIRMTDDTGGGLLIWVGLEKFHGLDELNDPQIKAAIRAAVDEWRKRTD